MGDFSRYQKQLDKMQHRDTQRNSGGGDYVWFTTSKPSRTGDSSRQKIRVVPRGEDHEEFWVTVDQHMLKVDGKTRAFVCPDDHDNRSGEKRCPLCKLSRALYASREPEYLALAKETSTRLRVFANVIDLEDSQHPEQPKIWGFSRTIHHSILDICMAKRSFIEDLEVGRDILLTTRRIGPQAFDIRYAVTDMDSSPLDPAFREIAKNAHDLEGLEKPADLDELHEIAATLDPRDSKSKRIVEYEPQPKAAAPPKAEPPKAEPPKAAPPKAEPKPAEGDWHYSGEEGQLEGISLDAVVKRVKASPNGQHFVWKTGMSDWVAASEVAEISAKLKPSKAPPSLPKRKGPPAPPTPRGGNAF